MESRSSSTDEYKASTTDQLISAIEKGSLEEVQKLIHSGINLNVLISTGKDPLGIAVNNLNFDLTKMLLEQGADPNFSKRVVEDLMIGMIMLEIGNEKRPIKIFGKETPIKVKTTLTPEKIEHAHRILDLLFCYGLNPVVEWSEPFKGGTTELTEVVEMQNAKSFSKKFASETIDIICQFKMKKGIMRTLKSTALKASYWLKNRKNPTPTQIPTYLNSLSFLKNKLNDYAEEVKSDKEKLRTRYRNEIHQGITILPFAIINVIINYAISLENFAKEVAAQRVKENRTLKFWKQPESNKFMEQAEAKFVIAAVRYSLASEDLEKFIGEAAHQIVLGYLMEEDEEFSDSVKPEEKGDRKSNLSGPKR